MSGWCWFNFRHKSKFFIPFPNDSFSFLWVICWILQVIKKLICPIHHAWTKSSQWPRITWLYPMFKNTAGKSKKLLLLDIPAELGDNPENSEWIIPVRTLGKYNGLSMKRSFWEQRLPNMATMIASRAIFYRPNRFFRQESLPKTDQTES
jgi:hypothetical protein